MAGDRNILMANIIMRHAYVPLAMLCGVIYTDAICPSSYYSNSGRCYRYFSTKLSWNDARSYCQGMHSGDLLSVHTYSLKYNVWSHTEGTDDGELWVGAYSGNYWLDGRIIPSSWWVPGEPSSDGESCVEVWEAGSRGTGLNDEECKYKQEFACQAEECYSIPNCISGSRCRWHSSYFNQDLCNTCSKGYYSGGQGMGCIKCDNGTFGQNCQSNCTGHCKNNVPCRKTDGHCPDGCAPGYTGETCSEMCHSGYFGYECNEKCSSHCAGGHENCYKANGTCLAGCNPGWTGRTCQEVCPNGRWGFNCANICMNCVQVSAACRNTDGFCLAGCIAGFKDTPFCDKECEDGTHGHKCQQTCNENCNDICYKTDGYCEKCKAGWQGYNCTEECDIGWYGINCTGQCSPACKDLSFCRKSDGYCDTETIMTTAVIGGVGAAVTIVISLGVLAVIWYLRRTRNGKNVKKNENGANRGVSMSGICSGDKVSGLKSTYETGKDTPKGGNADEHQYELPD